MTRAENVIRVLLLLAAVIAAVGFVLRFRGGGTVIDGQTVLSLLLLSALPLIAFWAAPGKPWLRALAFVAVFFASIAATISLLGLDEAMPVIETWLWMLAMVGGGVLYWRLQDDN